MYACGDTHVSVASAWYRSGCLCAMGCANGVGLTCRADVDFVAHAHTQCFVFLCLWGQRRQGFAVGTGKKMRIA